MKKILVSSMVTGLVATTLSAEPLQTHTELGYIETQGNTKTKTFNLDATAQKAFDKSEVKVKLNAQYAEDDGKEIKNQYLIELNYNYFMTERFFINYLVGYKEDKFSSFEYQFYTGPALGYKAVVSDLQNLTLEAGVLYSQDKYNDAAGTTEDYTSYRAKGLYDYKLAENTKFTEEASIKGQLDDTDNYFAYSKTAVVSKISDVFSGGVSYKVDYTHLPLPGKKKVDTTFMLNLIIDY